MVIKVNKNGSYDGSKHQVSITQTHNPIFNKIVLNFTLNIIWLLTYCLNSKILDLLQCLLWPTWYCRNSAHSFVANAAASWVDRQFWTWIRKPGVTTETVRCKWIWTRYPRHKCSIPEEKQPHAPYVLKQWNPRHIFQVWQ